MNERDRLRDLELQHAYNQGYIDAMRELARVRGEILKDAAERSRACCP